MRWASLAACAVVLGGAMPAAADTISSPPIYGGQTQSAAFCYVFNSSNQTGAVNVTQFYLYSDRGPGRSTAGTCSSSPLFPAGTCSAVFRNLDINRAYSCAAKLTGKAAARGSVEIRDANIRVLNRADMR